MSLQVNLTGADLTRAYQDVLNQNGIDWALFTYDKGTNDLKLQDTGSGGLEELEDVFSDGRIQYAFVRVKDPNTELPKFVQINWCGDGVPESKKGLFHTHSSAVARFLKGTHVVYNARNEADVSPAVIMKKVEDSSGARYTAHKEQPRKFEPIGPVGSSYQPTKVDINELRRAQAKPVSAPKPAQTYTPPAPSAPAAPAAPKPLSTKPVMPSWEDQSARSQIPVAAPPPPPTATRPIPSSTSATVSSGPAQVASATKPSKPAADDRIGPVGTNYQPVNLPPPKKLVNPFERTAQASTAAASAPKFSNLMASASAPKKLTWSERQALAKKQQEEEEEKSRAASFKPISPASTGNKWTPPAARSPAASTFSSAPVPPAAPAAPPLPSASRPVPAAEPPQEVEPEVAAPPPPPPPPAPPVAEMAAMSVEPTPAPPPPPPAPQASGGGLRATVIYDYEAEEENEMSLVEGETIEQIEEVAEGWWSGVGVGGKNGLFPANYVEVLPEEAPASAEAAFVPPPPPPPPPPPVEVTVPAPPPPAPAPPAPPVQAADEGVCAIALYDYDRAEENELSFREGDRITEIEAASEDWWQGKDKDGSIGLFPANYVEVQE